MLFASSRIVVEFLGGRKSSLQSSHITFKENTHRKAIRVLLETLIHDGAFEDGAEVQMVEGRGVLGTKFGHRSAGWVPRVLYILFDTFFVGKRVFNSLGFMCWNHQLQSVGTTHSFSGESLCTGTASERAESLQHGALSWVRPTFGFTQWQNPHKSWLSGVKLNQKPTRYFLRHLFFLLSTSPEFLLQTHLKIRTCTYIWYVIYMYVYMICNIWLMMGNTVHNRRSPRGRKRLGGRVGLKS